MQKKKLIEGGHKGRIVTIDNINIESLSYTRNIMFSTIEIEEIIYWSIGF